MYMLVLLAPVPIPSGDSASQNGLFTYNKYAFYEVNAVPQRDE